MGKCLYDFYERGYWDGIQFSYVPDFTLENAEKAWILGYHHAKDRTGLLEIDDFEKVVL